MFRFLAGMAAVLACTTCTRLDPSHCGNQDGNATCRALHEDAPVCDLCVGTRNGCIEASLVPACPAEDDVATDGGGAGSGAVSTMADDPTHEDSGTVDPTVESASGDGGTYGSSSTTTESDVDGSTSRGDPTDGETGLSSTSEGDSGGPFCGNEVIERPEECDGEELGDATCSSVLEDDDWGGDLACAPDCTYTTVNCCRKTGASCLLPLANQCCGECKLLGPGNLFGECT